MTYANTNEYEMMTERGEGGLGHPDWYPVEPTTTTKATEAMRPNPDVHVTASPQLERQMGYVCVGGMFSE